MRPIILHLAFVALAVVVSGCLKRDEFPIEPKLEYIGTVLNQSMVSQADSIGFVRFRFTDGDGDLGLNPNDTSGSFAPGELYYHNLFVRYFEKQNGDYVEFVPVFPFHSRFRNLTPTGGDKSLQGIMDVGVFSRPGSQWDTVRYEIFIVDRALNHSDTIVTEDIRVPF
ncbi:MAG: hypothetical protein K9J06_09250 [Flavobacteriales bacterium]|nr:hypothetical protein [Flavobacteriales bacterium]